MLRSCDVHEIVYGDATPRKVAYCPECDAWICDECRPKVTLRAVAALKRPKVTLRAVAALKRLVA